jgi:hypothetical protein
MVPVCVVLAGAMSAPDSIGTFSKPICTGVVVVADVEAVLEALVDA